MAHPVDHQLMHDNFNHSSSPLSNTLNDRFKSDSVDEILFEDNGSKLNEGVGMSKGPLKGARSTSANLFDKQHTDIDPYNDQLGLYPFRGSSDEEDNHNQDYLTYQSVARRLEQNFGNVDEETQPENHPPLSRIDLVRRHR